MRMPEYDDLDAIGLAGLVQKGEVSPEELLDAAMDRIEARNPALNAVVADLSERARGRMQALPDGPLKGVPFLVKDLKLNIAGTVTSNSSHNSRNIVAKESSVLAERYEAAGLQTLGKTNTPEFGIMGITEPALRGPCRNPWNTEHTPGGSSGGSGAAVAARIVPAAHAGDGGGSIRIPGSHCGLFGLKPTRGRVTMAPDSGESWAGFVQQHVLTRSVRDSALLLDLVDAPTPGEPYAAPAKERAWMEELEQAPGVLRIAVAEEPLFAGTTHPDCLAAVRDAVSLLEDMGHTVVQARPPFPRVELVRAYFVVVAGSVAHAVTSTAEAAGRSPRPGDYEPATWLLARIGWKCSSSDYIAAQEVIHRASRQVAGFFEEHDLLLTSTTAQPPARIGELMPTSAELLQMRLLRALPIGALLDVALEKMGEGKLAYTPNTQLFNQTGQPAMSVPLHWNAAGLPIGVQFASRFGDEATLFRLAARLEEARPWADRKPPLIKSA